jgi:hypothetical protein
MPRNSITVSLDESRADAALRLGAEELARQHATTLSAIGRAALSVAIDCPNLIESRLEKRWPGRRLSSSSSDR